jgi:anti-sigma B factor antagonist
MSQQVRRERRDTAAEPVRLKGVATSAHASTTVDFSVRVERFGDSHPVVVLTGEVDMYRAATVERELWRAIDAGGREVTVDLTGTSFIDSSFLCMLIGVRKHLDALGGHVAIVCDDANLLKVFEITGLDGAFAIRSSLVLDEAE